MANQTNTEGRPAECLALFRSRLLELTGATVPLFHPKPNECGVIIRNPDPLKRFVGLVIGGAGMPKTVYRPHFGGEETWFCKLRVFTSADLTGLLVTTMELHEDPDSQGEPVIRRFARFRDFPDWEHELLVFHFGGGCMYWMRHGDDIQAEMPVRAMAMLIQEHVSVMGETA